MLQMTSELGILTGGLEPQLKVLELQLRVLAQARIEPQPGEQLGGLELR